MKRLKNVLMVNALSSGATGLLLVSFPGFVAALFGTAAQWPFVAAGIFLILFAAYVFAQARTGAISRGKLKFIIAMDILWVVESAVILLPQLFGLTAVGYAIIAAVAAWVSLMAVLQIKGLRRLATV
jgi:hypothetical protein